MAQSSVPSKSQVALLVVDMQNAFCHPNGSFSHMLAGGEASIEMCQEAVPVCARLIECARVKQIPVIFTRYVYQAGYADRDILLQKYPDIERLRALEENSWDAQIVDELEPRVGDHVIDKSRYSAFYGTRLEPLLDGLGVRNLVVCGVTTNVCVESTVRDASQRHFDLLVVSDATGELTRERHTNALEILEYGFAKVVAANELLDEWEQR
jgi:ureidoacrylate peracid hydrolase